MNWLRKILGWTARDARIAELDQLLRFAEDELLYWKALQAETKKQLGAVTLPVLRIDETHTWTHSDRAAWRSFLAADLGRKFIAVTRAAHYRMLRAASEDHFHAGQSVHCARGFEEAIKWLQLLSVSADVPAQPTSRAHGEAQPGERDPEAALRESMSPR